MRFAPHSVALAVLFFALGCQGRPDVYEAPKVELYALLEAVPRELLFERPNPTSEENGWRMLAKGFCETPRIGQDSVLLFQETLAEIEKSNGAEKRKELARVFGRYESALSATEKRLAENHPCLIVPVPGASTADLITGLRVQLTLFTRRGAMSLIEGRLDDSIRDFGTAVKIVTRLNSAGGPLYYAVIASSLWTRLDREIRWAACHPNMTEAGLEELLQILPDEHSITEEFKRSIRAELFYFISNEVQRLKGPGGNSLLERDAKETFRDYDSGWDQADEIAAQVLEGHQKPFDRVETVASAVVIFREYLKNVDRNWNDQVPLSPLILSLVQGWPVSRLTGSPGNTSEAEEELARSKPELLADKNPYGKFALWYFLPISDHSEIAPFRARADIGATKIVIAARVFNSRNGRFPGLLSDLAHSRILNRVPGDPFTGRAFMYDAEKRRIRSTGPVLPPGSPPKQGAPTDLRQDYEWHFEGASVELISRNKAAQGLTSRKVGIAANKVEMQSHVIAPSAARAR